MRDIIEELRAAALKRPEEIDDLLLSRAADRIEEYCTDAAVAEEALLRCYLVAGGTIQELSPDGERNGIEEMAQFVLGALALQRSDMEPCEACAGAPSPICATCGGLGYIYSEGRPRHSPK